MVSGLLVIGVQGQGPSTFVREGETGILVEGRSVDSLQRALESCIKAPEVMAGKACKGKEEVMATYGWPSHGSQLLELYRELASSKSRGGYRG